MALLNLGLTFTTLDSHSSSTVARSLLLSTQYDERTPSTILDMEPITEADRGSRPEAAQISRLTAFLGNQTMV